MPRAYDPQAGDRALFDALIDARDDSARRSSILEDQERKPLSYTDLIRAAFALGRKIAAMTDKSERVGVLLPSSAGVVITFFALHAFGRTPVMLNFTAGIRNLKAACKVAGVKTHPDLTPVHRPGQTGRPGRRARRRLRDHLS